MAKFYVSASDPDADPAYAIDEPHTFYYVDGDRTLTATGEFYEHDRIREVLEHAAQTLNEPSPCYADFQHPNPK